MANIGKSITINGDVSGDEDLIIEGRVDGRIDLQNHHLTVGPNGEIRAEIAAKQVTIIGKVSGNVVASERAEVQEAGRLDGDLQAPVLSIQEGALINGAVTMKGVSSSVAPSAQAGAGSPPKHTGPSPQKNPAKPQQTV